MIQRMYQLTVLSLSSQLYAFPHFLASHHTLIFVCMMKKVPNLNGKILKICDPNFFSLVIELPWVIRRCLKWKLSSITPLVVRKTVINSGFRVIKEPKDWVGTWGKHMKSPLFSSVLSHQKVKTCILFTFIIITLDLLFLHSYHL